jgi:hypothetical protein
MATIAKRSVRVPLAHGSVALQLAVRSCAGEWSGTGNSGGVVGCVSASMGVSFVASICGFVAAGGVRVSTNLLRPIVLR